MHFCENLEIYLIYFNFLNFGERVIIKYAQFLPVTNTKKLIGGQTHKNIKLIYRICAKGEPNVYIDIKY